MKKLLTLALLAMPFMSHAVGTLAVFNEVYDGNSVLVNTSATQNYEKIDFMYIAFVHVNAEGNSNYDSTVPLGYLDWENTPYKPDNYKGGGKEWERQAYHNIYQLAHAINPKIKFIVSLGWGDQFNDIPTIENNLPVFISSLKTFIDKQIQLGAPIDGFDIDYETPGFSSINAFKLVSTAIRQALDDQGHKDSKYYYFTITPNNTHNLIGDDGLNKYYDFINVQSYTAWNDAPCPITDFIGRGSIGVNPVKALAGADTQNKGDDYIQANKDYHHYGLNGVFAWIFGSINGDWSPNYSSVLTPMYDATH